LDAPLVVAFTDDYVVAHRCRERGRPPLIEPFEGAALMALW
jgi:hypothetical protein